MPGFDQTGPLGEGPMTGGGRGRCATGKPGVQDVLFGGGRGGRPYGGGRGRCFGGGRGGRGRFSLFGLRRRSQTKTGEEEELREEIQFLTEQVAALRAELAALKGSEESSEQEK